MSSDPNPHAQRYLDLLHSVLDIAHDIAKDIHQQATAAPGPATPKADYTIPIERVARTIRRTILLALKVVEPTSSAPARANRIAARKRIIREVEDYINRCPDNDDDKVEALQAELMDRLDSPDLEDEIDTRPIPDIIIDIIHDLGLRDPKWGPNRFKRRTIEDIEALQARAAAPLPAEPRPPRPPTPRPERACQTTLPPDPAKAIATILGLARAGDG